MKKTQKVNYARKKIEKLQYAVQVWNTLSERQKELIYDQAGWN